MLKVRFYLPNYTIVFDMSFDGKVLSIDIETCPLFAMKIVSWCNFQVPKLLLWQKCSHRMIVIYLQPYCNISFISFMSMVYWLFEKKSFISSPFL